MYKRQLQDFGTKDGIDLIVGKLQAANITLNRFDVGMVNLRFLKIEGDHLFESFGKFLGKLAITGTDLECMVATSQMEREQIRDSPLF